MTSGRSRWSASPYSASATSSATARMRGTPSVAPDGDSTAPPVEASEGREPFQWTRPRYEHGARMTTPMMIRAEANNEFEAASRDPFLSDLTAILTRRERRLLPLDDAVRAARRDGQVDRGVREIPLDRIRGSESRTTDFDASFHPLKEHLRQRWTRLYMLVQDSREMPPIDVYQVDDVYFVKDGHHRVSVARRLGWETIRAQVVEVRTRAPLHGELNPERLIQVAEYGDFLVRTQLDRVRPDARLRCSGLGRYDVVLQHIEGHRYFLGMEQDREVPMSEAVASWYDLVYRPVMEVAERHRVADQLPGWTEADVYLALTRLWLDLDQEGRPAGPEGAVEALLSGEEPHLSRAGLSAHRARRLRRLRRLEREAVAGARPPRGPPARPGGGGGRPAPPRPAGGA